MKVRKTCFYFTLAEFIVELSLIFSYSSDGQEWLKTGLLAFASSESLLEPESATFYMKNTPSPAEDWHPVLWERVDAFLTSLVFWTYFKWKQVVSLCAAPADCGRRGGISPRQPFTKTKTQKQSAKPCPLNQQNIWVYVLGDGQQVPAAEWARTSVPDYQEKQRA